MRTLLAVDLSNQLYRATAAHKLLTCDGVFTGGLYGLLVSVSKAVNKVGATDILFCRDMRPYLRSTEYPEYKQKRVGNRDEETYLNFVEAMKQMVQLAADMGWPIWGIEGFESDDLIAKCVTSRKWRKVVAMSNDSDLYQLLDYHNFSIYRGSAQSVYDYKAFQHEWAMTTRDYKLVHAMMGTHNEIEGIRGVGPVTAKQIIRNPHEFRRTREVHGELIDRNMRLIELPHPLLPKDTTPPSTQFDFKHRTLIRHLAKYDIDVTVNMVKAFEALAHTGRS